MCESSVYFSAPHFWLVPHTSFALETALGCGIGFL